MKTEIENIKEALVEKISSIADKDPLPRFQQATYLIDEAMGTIKEQVRKQPFQNDQEEIWFFKSLRPAILSLRIEEALRYNLVVNKPIGTPKSQVKYFEDALKGFQSFMQLNAFYYQYYKNRFAELDHVYFKISAVQVSIPVPEVPDVDHEYSTPMSDLFAKFMAYEAVQRFIIHEIEDIVANGNGEHVKETAVELKWTGDVVNIVELAYGLWLTGQLNDGNASLNQIVKWLEANLQVNIGIAQRKFAEIARRKRLSVTKFIDKMKDAILHKIESDNE